MTKVKTHGNGFIRVYLSDDHLLHFYSSDIPRQVVSTETHDHRFSFDSLILQGELAQETFEEVPGNDFDVYTDEGDKLVSVERSCSLRLRSFETFKVGQSYHLEAGVIHRVWPVGTCLTEVKRTYGEPIPVRIYVRRGQVPDNSFNNSPITMGESR